MDNNQKASKRFEFLLVLSVVFLSMDTLIFGTNADPKAKVLLVAITGIITIYLIVCRWMKNGYYIVSRNNFSILYCLIFLLMLSQLKSIVFQGSGIEVQYLYNYIIIVFVFEVSRIVTVSSFIRKYVDVMCMLAGVAIALYIFDALDIIGRIPSIKLINRSGYRFYYFGIGAVLEHMQYYTVRAYGIFREPGVFSIYLCIALCILLFFTEKIDIKRLLLLSMAVVLTFSTAGYIIFVAEMILFTMTQTVKKSERYLKLSVFVIAFVFIVVAMGRLYNDVFGKLHTENDSLNSRTYSIVSGFMLSIKAPFLGNGWNYITNNFGEITQQTLGITNVSFTNTYLRMASTYGWIFTLIMLIKMYSFFRNNINTIRTKYPSFFSTVLFFLWLVMFSNEGMMLNPLLYMWMFSKEKNNGIESI